jgi:hypothetical protein
VALTVTKVSSFCIGNHRMVTADVRFDSSYRTGGLALAGKDFGLNTQLVSVIATPTTGGYVCPYDYANAKLMAFNGTTQISSATDLSAQTTRVVAIGKGYGL